MEHQRKRDLSCHSGFSSSANPMRRRQDHRQRSQYWRHRFPPLLFVILRKFVFTTRQDYLKFCHRHRSSLFYASRNLSMSNTPTKESWLTAFTQGPLNPTCRSLLLQKSGTRSSTRQKSHLTLSSGLSKNVASGWLAGTLVVYGIWRVYSPRSRRLSKGIN